MQIKIFIYFFLILLVASCQDPKEDAPVTPAEPEEPKITITTPTLNQHYNQGENIIIAATISDNKQVYITSAQIKNLITGATLYDSGEIHNHASSFPLNLSYNVSSSVAANYLVIIKTTDFDSHVTEKSVQIWVN